MGRLMDIGERLVAAGGQDGSVVNRSVMEFSPIKDAENLALWKYMENVRYKKEGFREDVVLRGGTKEAYDLGANDVISMDTFSSSYGGTTYSYGIFWKDDSLDLYNFDMETNTYLGNSNTLGFNFTDRVQFVVNGRFVYLFQTNSGVAHYIDLKEKSVQKWLGTPTNNILSSIWLSGGDFKEGNIWGFKEGGSVYAYIDTFTWSSIPISMLLDTPTMPRGVYKYVYNGGKYIEIDGLEYKDDALIQLDSSTTIGIAGTGTEFEFDSGDPKVPVVNGSVDFRAQLTKITKMTTGEAVNVETGYPWEGYEGNMGISSISRFGIMPVGVDLEVFLENTGKFKVKDKDIIVDSTWSAPTLYRAYTMCYELDDGSITHPSIPFTVEMQVTSIMSGDELYYRGVKLKHADGGFPVPENAVRGLLFASRWQVTEKDCFGTSPEYPNGTFYFAKAFALDTNWVEDFTPDRELLQTMSTFVPHSDGKPTIFGLNSLEPNSVAAVEGSVLLAGYTLNRPIPFNEVSFDATGTVELLFDLHLDVVFEYSDGSRSRALSNFSSLMDLEFRSATNVFRVHTLPALVSKITLYMDNRTDGKHYLVKEIDDTMPEWYGFGLDISVVVESYNEITLVDGLETDEHVRLDNFIAWGSPMQMVDIASQKPILGVQCIEHIYMRTLDDQRGDALRYLLYVIANEQQVLGYLSATVGTDGFVFDVVSEQLAQGLPVKGVYAHAPFMNGIVLQGYDGVYIWEGKEIRKIVYDGQYDILKDSFVDYAWHSRENELWLLGRYNKVLVLRYQVEGEIPSLTSYIMNFEMIANEFTNISSLNDKLYGTFGPNFNEIDVQGFSYDTGVGTTELAITGVLESDYLCGVFEQMYFDVFEVVGKGLDCVVSVDLQNTRFDDGTGSWKVDFNADEGYDALTLTMKGVMQAVYSRGISPRIRLSLTFSTAGLAEGGQRLSAARLYYNLLESEGVVRS